VAKKAHDATGIRSWLAVADFWGNSVVSWRGGIRCSGIRRITLFTFRISDTDCDVETRNWMQKRSHPTIVNAEEMRIRGRENFARLAIEES
jgi:hypothetical protein